MTVIHHDFSQPEVAGQQAKEKEQKPIPNYQLRMQLTFSNPLIWRTIQIPGSMMLADLKGVIEDCFSLTASPDHRFLVGKIFYGPFSPQDCGTTDTEPGPQLHELEEGMGFIFTYVHDSDGNWECEIELEKTLAKNSTISGPVLIAGEGASPATACADIHEYQQTLTELESAESGQAAAILKELELEIDFDPSDCDIKKIADRLQHRFT